MHRKPGYLWLLALCTLEVNFWLCDRCGLERLEKEYEVDKLCDHVGAEAIEILPCKGAEIFK